MLAGKISGRLFLWNALLLAILFFAGVAVHSAARYQIRSQALVQAVHADASALQLLIDESSDEPDWPRVLSVFASRNIRIVRVGTDGKLIAAYGAGNDADLERDAAPELSQLDSNSIVTAARTIAGKPWVIEARRCTTSGTIWVGVPYGDASLIDVVTLVVAAAIAMFAALLNLTIAVAVARRHAAPLRELSEAARRLAAGDLSARTDAAQLDDIGVVARALNDIRDRLATHTTAISRQQFTLDALLTQLHEGIVVASADGRIVLVNATALRMLNVTGLAAPTAEDCRRLIGAALERAVPRRDLQDLLRASKAKPGAAESHNAVGDMAVESIQVDQPGGDMHLLARASDIILPGNDAASGKPVHGRLLLLTDITELARTVQIKSDFVANASHELRTPLTAIRSAIEALLDMNLAEESEYAQKFLRMIDRHSVRLIALVSDLLDLSKIESPKRAFDAHRMDWLNVSRDLYERFENRIVAKQIRWNCPVRDDARRGFHASAYLLTLVLDNLVDNAIKFTPEGGQITVNFTRDDRSATFEVIDSGCGIAPEHHRRIFERFYQVERARSGAERGTGLGLSIVRHSITAMRGTIELTSQPGTGTRFVVRIPQSADITPPPYVPAT